MEQRTIREENEDFPLNLHGRVLASIVQENLLISAYIVEIYFDSKTKKYYALVRLKRTDMMNALRQGAQQVMRETERHIARGKAAQAQGRLIDALTEFGQGWQKALILPLIFPRNFDQRRYSEHLEELLNELVRGVSLRELSEVRKVSFHDNSEKQKLSFWCYLVDTHYIPLKQLPLTATYIESGGESNGLLRSLTGQEGNSVKIITNDNGQAEVFIQEQGESSLKNGVRITLDEASIKRLEGLIGQNQVSALLNKEVIVSLSESQQKYRVAVLPFENLRQDTEMNWLARYFQKSLTNKLTLAKNIVLLEQIDLSAILEELHIQMSKLTDIRTAIRIGKMLGATHIIIGTYTVKGTRLHVLARLVNVEKGLIGLTAEEESDVIEVQSQMSTAFFNLVGKLAYSLAIQLDPELDKEDFLRSSVFPLNPPVNPSYRTKE